MGGAREKNLTNQRKNLHEKGLQNKKGVML